MLELDTYVFQLAAPEVILDLELSNEGHVEEEETQIDEELTIRVADLLRLVDLPQTAIIYIRQGVLLKVG